MHDHALIDEFRNSGTSTERLSHYVLPGTVRVAFALEGMVVRVVHGDNIT